MGGLPPHLLTSLHHYINPGLLYCFSLAAPGAPGTPTATVVNSNTISLSWTEILCLAKNGLVYGYNIKYWHINKFINVRTIFNTTTHLITGLKSFTDYTFTVAGVNSVGIGSYSSPSDVIRTDEDSEYYFIHYSIDFSDQLFTYLKHCIIAPRGHPGIPNATVTMSTSITLIWTEIAVSERNGVITSYKIQYGEKGNRDRLINTQSSATTHLITGLKPFTQYTFTVAGVNSVNTGPYSGASDIIQTTADGKFVIVKLLYKCFQVVILIICWYLFVLSYFLSQKAFKKCFWSCFVNIGYI